MMQKADDALRLNFFNLKTIIISVKTFEADGMKTPSMTSLSTLCV